MNLLLTVGKSILMRKPTSHRETVQYFKLFFEGEIKKPKLEVVGEIGQIISVSETISYSETKILVDAFYWQQFYNSKSTTHASLFHKKR